MLANQKIEKINNSTYLKSYETQLYRKGSIIYCKGKKIGQGTFGNIFVYENVYENNPNVSKIVDKNKFIIKNRTKVNYIYF